MERAPEGLAGDTGGPVAVSEDNAHRLAWRYGGICTAARALGVSEGRFRYWLDPDRQKTAARHWYAANAERAREIARRYRETNREKARAAVRRYDANHREQRNEYARRAWAEGRTWGQQPENALSVELAKERYTRKKLLEQGEQRLQERGLR